jgi:shikimate dehydrogenase
LTKELVGEVVFINRTPSRAKALAQQVRAWSPHIKASGFALDDPSLPMLLARADLLINATALGLQVTDPLPLSVEGLKSDTVVCDLVYSRGGTPFARLARERGLKTMDGFPMLVHQGALAFEIWTGQKAPIRIMQEAIQRGLA